MIENMPPTATTGSKNVTGTKLVEIRLQTSAINTFPYLDIGALFRYTSPTYKISDLFPPKNVPPKTAQIPCDLCPHYVPNDDVFLVSCCHYCLGFPGVCLMLTTLVRRITLLRQIID